MESGGDLVNGVIEIAPGVVIDDRLRVRGIKWLQNFTGKKFAELTSEWPETPGIEEMCPLLMALLIQRNPDMSVEKAQELIDDVDVSVIAKIVGSLKVFDTEPKNSQPPNLVETTTPA